MLKQIRKFTIDGDPIFCTRFGQGHINETYLVVDSTGRQYILQKINKLVLTNPVALMENIVLVTEHLQKSITEPREALKLVPTYDGKYWIKDVNNDYWRMYDYISDSICLQQAHSVNNFYESAIAFGKFQRQLADFEVDKLNETIPKFHDTPNRYRLFKNALKSNVCGRVKDVQKEIDFVIAREEYSKTLMNLYLNNKLPLRVTHNDTKLNNVLFDRFTRKALCVIDFDTVMPGFSVNDFGDSIRFGASTAAEDECDLRKVEISLPLFESYTEGFLAVCGEDLNNCEIEYLCDGAKMMTLECGVRFLTDYLLGDVYFRTHRIRHNLDRCRTQFKLVRDMENKWEAMQNIVTRRAGK